MRNALMDTACVAVWNNSSYDQYHIDKVAAFSQMYHATTNQYGNGAYIGEPVLDLAGSFHPGWETLYWGNSTTTNTVARLHAIKARVDPKNVFQCTQCIAN